MIHLSQPILTAALRHNITIAPPDGISTLSRRIDKKTAKNPAKSAARQPECRPLFHLGKIAGRRCNTAGFRTPVLTLFKTPVPAVGLTVAQAIGANRDKRKDSTS